MDTQLLWFLTLSAWFLTLLSAIAHQVIREVSWHELEEYCQQKRSNRFGQIFDLRDSISLGTLLLKMLSASSAVAGTCFLMMGPAAEVSPRTFWWSLLLVILGLTFAGGLIPWAVSQVSATGFLFRTWRIWWLVSSLATPLIASATILEQTLFRASGISNEEQEELDEEAAEDEIMSMVAEAEHDGHIDEEKRDMIEGVMELDDNDVGQVMTPRSRIDALDIEAEWEQMLMIVVESGRTRIPIYQDSIDNVIGILYAKDILRESLKSESKRKPLAKLIREPIEVPDSTLLDEMLQKFLDQHVHMAIVKDEYGGVAGVVTIEDVLEEIVGEIVDETDEEEMDDIRQIDDSSAEVAGTTHLNRLNEAMGLTLPEDQEFDTVAGLIMRELNEIPRSGKDIIFDNVRFRVEQANRRGIELVLVEVLADTKLNETGSTSN
ncbi:MAG: hemolysin family protein [Planctomycetota bacterium]